jgi:hypothetical protein
MRSPCRLYILRINLWIPEPIFMWLCMYIMASEPFATAYFMNPSHQSVCVSPPSFLGNSSINAFPRQQNIVGCVGFCAVRVVSEEPLVIVMLPLYHFIITCAVSGHILGLFSFETFLLHRSSRVLHVSCTFLLSHRGQICGTAESHCIFHLIWITLASKMQLSRAVCYSSPNPPPPKATERILFSSANKSCIIDVKNEILLHCTCSAVALLCHNY